MFKSLKCIDGDYILHITILLLCLLPVVASFFLFTDGNSVLLRFPAPIKGIDTPCFFNLATGYRCPVCGMTRAFTYMSAFDLNKAWQMHKAATMLYLLCIIQIPYRFMLLYRVRIPYEHLVKTFMKIYIIVIIFFIVWEFVIQFV